MWWRLLAQEGYADHGTDDHSRAMVTLVLDVRKCGASKREDLARILAHIRGHEDAINEAVRASCWQSVDVAHVLQAARRDEGLALNEMRQPVCCDAGLTTSLHVAAGAGRYAAVTTAT